MAFRAIMISCTLAISTLFVASAIECDWGSFRMLDDTCVYRCGSDQWFNLSALSFDFIKTECPNVREAAMNRICDGIEDLVYRSDRCACPYCKCQSPGSELKEYFLYTPWKECMNCTCQQPDSLWGINEDIYSCTTLTEASTPREWYYYSCPPNQCVITKLNSNEPIIKEAGDSWWADVADSDTDCQTFCHCSSEGEAICKTGWENIFADEWLKYAFMDECGGSGKDTGAVKLFDNLTKKPTLNVSVNNQCWDEAGNIDVSRLSTGDQGPYCGSDSCPKCACPQENIERDEWCHIYKYGHDGDYNNEWVCQSNYTCDRSGDGNLYSNNKGWSGCASLRWQSCGTQEDEDKDTYSCHIQFSQTATVTETLNAELWSVEEPFNAKYCAWRYDTGLFNNCTEYYCHGELGNWTYGWEGTSWFEDFGLLCDTFANDKCIYVEPFTYYGCDGEPNTETIWLADTAIKCCDASKSENCNYKAIEIDTCTRSTDLEDIYADHFSCSHDVFYCGLDPGQNYVEELTCDGILNHYKEGYAKCMCQMNSAFYNRASTGVRDYFEAGGVFDYVPMAASYLENVNPLLEMMGCNIHLSCDLITGEIINGSRSCDNTSTSYTSTSTTPESGNDNEVCLASSKCKSITSDTICSDDMDCLPDGDSFICATNYAFCYFSECTTSDQCQTIYGNGYECETKTGEKDGNGYFYGVCTAINTDAANCEFEIVAVIIAFIIFIIV